MKRIISLLALASIAPAFSYDWLVHNNTDTAMRVQLDEALASNVNAIIPAGQTQTIKSAHPGACTKAINAIGIGDPKSGQRGVAIGLSARYPYSGTFGLCGSREIYINYIAPNTSSVNVNVGGTQTAGAPTGSGSLEIKSLVK
jgi:hypothetical protein